MRYQYMEPRLVRGMRDGGWGMGDEGCEIRDAGCGMRDAGFSHLVSRISNLVSRHPRPPKCHLKISPKSSRPPCAQPLTGDRQELNSTVSAALRAASEQHVARVRISTVGCLARLHGRIPASGAPAQRSDAPSLVAPASGHLLNAPARPPWGQIPNRRMLGRVDGRKRDPLGSDPGDAHRIGIRTTRP